MLISTLVYFSCSSLGSRMDGLRERAMDKNSAYLKGSIADGTRDNKKRSREESSIDNSQDTSKRLGIDVSSSGQNTDKGGLLDKGEGSVSRRLQLNNRTIVGCEESHIYLHPTIAKNKDIALKKEQIEILRPHVTATGIDGLSNVSTINSLVKHECYSGRSTTVIELLSPLVHFDKLPIYKEDKLYFQNLCAKHIDDYPKKSDPKIKDHLFIKMTNCINTLIAICGEGNNFRQLFYVDSKTNYRCTLFHFLVHEFSKISDTSEETLAVFMKREASKILGLDSGLVNCVDSCGKTPLDTAIPNKNKALIDFIKVNGGEPSRHETAVVHLHSHTDLVNDKVDSKQQTERLCYDQEDQRNNHTITQSSSGESLIYLDSSIAKNKNIPLTEEQIKVLLPHMRSAGKDGLGRLSTINCLLDAAFWRGKYIDLIPCLASLIRFDKLSFYQADSLYFHRRYLMHLNTYCGINDKEIVRNANEGSDIAESFEYQEYKRVKKETERRIKRDCVAGMTGCRDALIVIDKEGANSLTGLNRVLRQLVCADSTMKNKATLFHHLIFAASEVSEEVSEEVSDGNEISFTKYIIKELEAMLKASENLINCVDSTGKTPLDTAKAGKNEKLRAWIVGKGGRATVSFLKKNHTITQNSREKSPVYLHSSIAKNKGIPLSELQIERFQEWYRMVDRASLSTTEFINSIVISACWFGKYRGRLIPCLVPLVHFDKLPLYTGDNMYFHRAYMQCLDYYISFLDEGKIDMFFDVLGKKKSCFDVLMAICKEKQVDACQAGLSDILRSLVRKDLTTEYRCTLFHYGIYKLASVDDKNSPMLTENVLRDLKTMLECDGGLLNCKDSSGMTPLDEVKASKNKIVKDWIEAANLPQGAIRIDTSVAKKEWAYLTKEVQEALSYFHEQKIGKRIHPEDFLNPGVIANLVRNAVHYQAMDIITKLIDVVDFSKLQLYKSDASLYLHCEYKQHIHRLESSMTRVTAVEREPSLTVLLNIAANERKFSRKSILQRLIYTNSVEGNDYRSTILQFIAQKYAKNNQQSESDFSGMLELDIKRMLEADDLLVNCLDSLNRTCLDILICDSANDQMKRIIINKGGKRAKELHS